MEQRLLLAADLTGVVQSAALIDPAVPTNTASAVVRVQNSGNANVAQSQIGVYASLDTVLDSSDLLLGTANTGSVAAGASKNVTVNLTVPNTLQPIDHTLLAKVDNANAIAENSETNNVAVGGTINGTWQFGTVPGRTGNTTLTLREADGTVVTFRLTGPGLGEVIKDGTTWDLNVTGTTASSAVTITTNSAGSGRVTLNDIHVLGTIGTLLAATTDLTGTLAIDGPVNIPGAAPGTVTLRSVQGGTVAMPSVEALTILGPTTNAKFYIGATLGQDGQPGGTGANADTYGPGKIGLFTVTGSMTNTTVRVGVDPVDGTYGNSNDQLIGGTSSAIDGIVIGGSLSADTRFYAGKFPTQYLNRTTLKPTAGDVHFVTLVSGSPTTLTAALQQDTGSFTSDGLTKDPTIVGTLTDLDGIATFTASFSTTPTFNVLSDRQSNGAFIFSRARLEEIARSEGIMNTGEPLPDGTYVLTLRAMDTGGNPTQISVPVTLDTAIPGLTLDLDPASDTAPLGDSETTNATVTLVGHTEGNASVELVGLGLTTTADASGQFGFTNVALTLGANALTVRAMDTAGNQRTETKTITRVQADSDGDGILDTDEGVGPNGGDANNDGIADSQQANVASLRNTVDNQYVTLVSPTGTQLTDVTAGAVAPGAPAGIEFPFGQIGFEVHGVTPGGSAEVTMLLPDGSGVNGFYKFGPEPGASPLNQPHWYDFNLNGGTGAAISGNTVTLNLKDGDRGDADLAANGVIVDPGGVAFTNHAPELAVIKKQAVVEEELLTFTASATDPDAGQTLTYSLGADAPAGMAINAETGVVTWTPTASDVGVYTLTVRVTDDGSGALSAEQAVTVRVMAEGVVEWAGVGAGSSWSDPLNWSTGEVPDATSDVVIRGATTVTLHNDNPEVNVSIKSLTMDAETTLRLGATAPWRFDVLEAAQGGTIELTGNVELQVQGATVLEHLTLVGGHAVFVGSATLGQLESGVFDPGDPHYTGPGGDGHLGDVEFLQAATIHDLAIGSGALAHGSALTLTGQGRVLGTVNANTLTIAAGASLDLVHQQGFGSLVNGGSVTLAAGIPLTLTGNYTQTGSGVLRIAVSEQNTVGTIAVGGTATLDGTLQVTASGTLPEPIELVLMTFGAKSGAFSTVQLPTLPAGQTILFDATGETELLLALNTTPLNSAPVAMTDSYTTAEGTPLVITALGVLTNDTDANHDPLTAVLVSEPAHGNLTLNANGSFTYTPNADFNGTDSFTYKANDGTADSNIATVNLTMTAVNDTPVAVPDTLTVMEDTAETYTAAQLVGNDTDVDSSSLAIESVTNGTGGTVVLNSNETVTFTPTANFNGQASFSYTVTDGDLTSAPATVTVNVTAVNDGPVAQASTVTTNEDQAKTFAVTDFGFTDVEGDSLASITISSLTLASGDTLTLSGTDVTAGQTITAANIANLVYTPAANANGSARSTFAFTVNDAASGTEVATMTIDVTAVNQAPVAVSDTLTATEDTAETYPASQLVSNDTDGDADALTVASVTNGTGGTVVLNGNGTVTFTPTANFNGEANFSYTVTDGDLTSAPATVTVNVTPVNDAPSFTTGPDQAVQEDAGAITVPNWATSISAGPSDESGQQLTFVVTNDNNTLFSVQPTVAPDGTLTFASAPNVFGTATVTVMLRDDGGTANGGSDTSAAQTFSLTVTPVNDGPTVLNPIADVTVPEDAADTVIDLAGATPVFADVETAAGALTYSVTSSAPSVVAATVDNVSDKLTLAYPPNASGTATITVTASDGVLTVSDSFEVTVTAVNQAPAADAQTVTTTEDTAKTITLSGSDSDADSLTYTIVDGPQHGTLTGTGATRIYTPNTNYGGPDSFTFTVNDGTVDSNVATVTIDVTAVNDAPVLGPIGNRSVSEEDRLTFIVNASDPDGLTTLAFSLENGVGGEVPPGASIDALGTFTWTPTEVQGPGSYTFDVVATETGTPALAGRETITVAVSEVNRAPILQAISDQTITAGQQLAFTAVGIDFDLPANSPASTLTYSIDLSNLPPGYGTLNTPAIDPSTGVFTWTPAEGQVGAHVITVRVENELRDGLFAEQQVRFNVESANHAPVLNPIADRTINEGETLTFTAVATDPDVGQVLTFSLLDAPEGANIGTLSGVFSWIPTEAQGPGNYQVTLAVSDGVLTTSSTISITVSEVNQAPVANAQSVTTPEDSSKTITLTGSDGDGNPLTYTIVDGPTHGTLTGTGATRTYTPTANYNGPDSFTFRANDGTVDSVPAMVAITVTPVNDVPVADAQMVTTAEDTAKPITLTGSDVEDDPLTFSIVDSPQHGTLIGTDATRTYTPAPNFSGTDSFTFRINDGQMDSNVATVTIMVTPAVAGVRWINSAGGDWNVASNWSTGVVPTATDDVVVDLAGTYTITHSTGTTQIKSLKSEHQINLTGGTLEVAETVEMNGAILTLMGGTLKNATVNGTGVSGVVIQVVGDSTLHGVVLEGPIAMTVASSALLTIERGLTLNGDISSGTQAVVTIYGSMVMTGPTTEVQTINGTGGWIYLYGVGSRVSGTSGIHLEIGANIGIFSGSSGIIGSQDSTVTGLGYIQTTANGSLELIHFSNSSQGSYLDVFGSLSVSGLFTNSGRIEAHGGANLDFLDLNNEGDILVFSPGSAAQQTATINMMGANPLINRGTIQIWNGLTLALTGSLTNTFDGRILLRQADASYGDGHLAVTEDVTNEGQSIAVEDGSMTVGGNLNNQAALDLGTGLAHVTGDYIQSDTGTLSVVLGSTTNFGRLEIEGSATLSGHFRQVTGGSNTPTDRYQFMTFAGGRTGFFTTQDLILYAIDETDPNDLELFFVGL